ncbi:uncharacterized protein LOC133185593 [Saccostrea echinata]|uniref:uncharacterized protein LOC133185593 n=1 Tax=Saccostrea echinata TaxID=191078 RepID=UPI002A82A071|nr:uncharacterized protein LOC133185593 [Saccostrea echinata]XP_061176884.1 uncharacterized protein LOC133185593 [Saccostrea echinata]XP_061176885.1 uncharacterized protein LOC133185593 [Saccostrea echinata]XP_061176886.1 uncharacterized protein LOC133185593 [Saccostrea echinata]
MNACIVWNKLIFLVCAVLQVSQAAQMKNIYVSGCNDDEIKLECPDKHKIAIKRVYYGAKLDSNCSKRSPLWSSGCCERGKGDCLVPNSDIYTTMNIRCSGYQNCQTKVERIRTKHHCAREIKHTTYMTVVYSCVAESDIAQFCNNEIKQGQELYLSNQNYPLPIKGGGQYCKCLVRSSTGISINIIDIMITLPEKTDMCPQQLRISDSSSLPSVVVQCGQNGMYGFRNLYHRMVTNLTVTLDSRSEDSRGYIWINVRAQQPEDYVVIYCGEAMDQLLYRNITKGVSSDSPQVTVSPLGTVSPSGNGTVPDELTESQIIPDMIAIIGGVAGAMAVILIVCVVAIAVHCTRERERSNLPKMPEVIPSPMVRGKVYHPDDKNATHKKYQYEEDRYCSIKRSPMKLTNFSELDDEADKKLKEAFLQGPAEEIDPEPPVSPINQVKVNGVPPRPRSPELPLLLDPPPDYCSVPESDPERYFTMNPQKPLSEMTEIRVISSLPQRGHKSKKPKTVTFSPVALVTPLPSGSEESIGSEGDRNLANIIDSYQCLHDDDFPPKKPIILPPPNETGEFASIHGPNETEIAEMQELWNTLGSPSVSTTLDDGAYDNIDYLLAQNKSRHENEV